MKRGEEKEKTRKKLMAGKESKRGKGKEWREESKE